MAASEFTTPAFAAGPVAAQPGGAEAGAALPRDLVPPGALLDPSRWLAVPAEGVELAVRRDEGADGRPVLRLDYDFHGRGGWAAARFPLAVTLPESYEVRFSLRGAGPPNDLEVKLVGPAGDNVWWNVHHDVDWPAGWSPWRIKKRQIAFAWGPAGGGEPERIGALELAITAGEGECGSLWLADLRLLETEPSRPPAGPPRALPSIDLRTDPEHPPELALDGDPATAWRVAADESGTLTADLQGLVELGGLRLLWQKGHEPRELRVELSEDGEHWTAAREVDPAGAGTSWLRLPDAEARRLRVVLGTDACPADCGLAELALLPLAAGADENAFFQAVAADAPRGAYPRGFSGEAVYWTVAGADGAVAEALVSEDGAVELGERSPSLEPFVSEGDRLWSWADVDSSVSLADGYLPIPTVTRDMEGLRLAITALAPAGSPVAGDTPAGAADMADADEPDVPRAEVPRADVPRADIPRAEVPRADVPRADIPRADVPRADAPLLVRYRLSNGSAAPRRGRLFLAARPFQVNPPYQFLNVAGGVAPLHEIACTDDGLTFDGGRRLTAAPAAARCGVLTFDEGRLDEQIAAGTVPEAERRSDPFGRASGVLVWDFDLDPGETSEIVVRAGLAAGWRPTPVAAEAASSADARIAAAARGTSRPSSTAGASVAEPGVSPPPARLAVAGAGRSSETLGTDGAVPATPLSPAVFDAAETAARAAWHAELDRLVLDLPPEAAALADTLRSSLAWVLVHRDGPAIQPGSRAYARSWIRDGALTGAALLRLGQDEVVEEFAEWFAGFQYPNGMVPCCVDRSGAGPVPENDSHGELIHLVSEVYRYTRDRGFLERLFPHVEQAVDYIETLRQQRRTPAEQTPERRIFFGLLPESISHEGYSAKPVHSYWDDTFAYRGLDDAGALAEALGRGELAAEWSRRRDELRRDLLASIALVRRRAGLDVLPASADLADFDPTSSTTLLDPGGLGPWLPQDALRATFERYWRDFVARRDGTQKWDAYTPYEIRNVGAFVRLGWRGRAQELLAWFLGDRRPPAWNGWPEVVTRDPRQPRFVGDMPHGWVASDFIRSALDLFAYEDRGRQALVLAAGVPAAWLARPEGVAIGRLATPWGELGYRLSRRGDGVRYAIDAGGAVPPGGLVLTWPLAGAAGSAVIDGEPAALAEDGTLHLRRAAATVDLLPAADGTGAAGR